MLVLGLGGDHKLAWLLPLHTLYFVKEDKYPLHDHKYISKLASVTSVTSEIPEATDMRITNYKF